VCVCTFQRPNLLARLLDRLERQARGPEFIVDVVVVDNDERRSSEEVVAEFARRGAMTVSYHSEPDRNISLARNLAVRNASGNLLAFIDDDESPHDEWLVRLFRTLRQHRADGVLGPVIPDYPPGAPAWLERSRVLERQRHATGSRISLNDARTGNVLLERSLFAPNEPWFDPAFGRTGGEDSDFFARQFEKGRIFVWCDEAVAYETIPAERWKKSFHLKRMWRAGLSTGEWIRAGRLSAVSLLPKYFVILTGAVLSFAFTLLTPKHVRMFVLQKMAYSAAVFAGYCGLALFRERE
jgi:succinoglycan biosynthesis protein ExoM